MKRPVRWHLQDASLLVVFVAEPPRADVAGAVFNLAGTQTAVLLAQLSLPCSASSTPFKNAGPKRAVLRAQSTCDDALVALGRCTHPFPTMPHTKA